MFVSRVRMAKAWGQDASFYGGRCPSDLPRRHVPAPLTQSYRYTYDRNSSYAVVYNSRVFLTRNHKLWPPCASYCNSFTGSRYAHAEQHCPALSVYFLVSLNRCIMNERMNDWFICQAQTQCRYNKKQYGGNRKAAEAVLTSVAKKQTNQHTNTKLIRWSETHTETHAYRKMCTHTQIKIDYLCVIYRIN